MSAQVVRNIGGRADEISTAVTQRVGEMTQLLDEKSNGLLSAISGKGSELAGEVGRITDQAVKAIEAKSFVFTQTMMENSEEIARLVNDASLTATSAITRSLGQLQEGAQGVSDTARLSITRTLEDVQTAHRTAIEESKQIATSTIADMLETHGMLRSDTTALFERLREANILLQEVLSGAHENMGSLERTMVTRVSEFVAAMNDLTLKSDASASVVQQQVGAFNATSARALQELGELAGNSTPTAARSPKRSSCLEKSNRRTEESVAGKRQAIEALMSTLDTRTDDFAQRLQRFSGLLDESLDAATSRAREIASVIAETSNTSVQTIEQQYELVRTTSEEERRRTSETLGALYEEAAGQAHGLLHQSAERFTEIMQGLKQMAGGHAAGAGNDARRTAPRHFRIAAGDRGKRRADAAGDRRSDRGAGRAQPHRRPPWPLVRQHRPDANRRGANPSRPTPTTRGRSRGRRRPAMSPARPGRSHRAAILPARRADRRRPPQGANGRNSNGGWLSDLLTRASRDDSPPIAPPAGRGDDRSRDNAESLESLAVDIARMIDHETAADLWERYKRGERGIFTRRLYTAQGQKAFDEIRRKYRADPEFRQTVEQYIHEFERLLDDVARGDRGMAGARNYLTSDTGKVYTMLAHAAGRFDQIRPV